MKVIKANGERREATQAELIAARKYAAEIPRKLAAEALTADYYADHVTIQDRVEIKERELKRAEQIENGEHDHNFTIWQRMNYYITGESIALLP